MSTATITAVATKTYYADTGGTAAVVRAALPTLAARYLAAECGMAVSDVTARPVDEQQARLIHAALAAGEWHGWPVGTSAHDARAFWVDLEQRVVPAAASAIPTVREALVAVEASGTVAGWQVGA